MAKVRIINKRRQGMNILLKDGEGKLRQWTIPSLGSRVIEEIEMSQDITDKETKGYVQVEVIQPPE